MTKKTPAQDGLELQHQLEKARLQREQLRELDAVQALGSGPSTGIELVRQVERMIGHAESFGGVSKFANALALLKLKTIKENKLYQAFDENGEPVDRKKVANGQQRTMRWKEFCERFLPRSHQTIDENLRNLDAFGADALDSLSSIGVGYRDLRRLRKLPEEERTLILNQEVVQAGDREQLIDLIQEMSAKHTKEKEGLQSRTEELQDELQAARDHCQKRDQKIDELQTALERRENLAPSERAQELRERLSREADAAARALLPVESVLNEIMGWEDAPRDLQLACVHELDEIESKLGELRLNFPLVDRPPEAAERDD